MSHSIIPPSSAGIWGKPDGCTGWVLMSQQFPETEEKPEAAEGDASHEIGAALIQYAAKGINNITADKFIGKTATNGVIFTEEMFDAAETYANDVATVMRECRVFGGPNLGIEKRVEAKRIHDISFGTTDNFIYDRQRRYLFIWDYKFGYEIVEVFENWQLINYFAGIIEFLEIDGLEDQEITVHFRVAQPRAFHRDGPIREWVIKASDLRAHINILHANANEALGPNAMCRSGSHCKHCTARHACEAGLTAGMGLYEVAARPVPITLSAAAMGVQLAIITRARKHLERLEIAFQEQAKSTIRGGKLVPGWKIMQGVGREKWTKPVAEVIALGDMLDKDLRAPLEAIAPSKARKLGIDDTVIKAYSIKPLTSLNLVQDDGIKTKMLFSGE